MKRKIYHKKFYYGFKIKPYYGFKKKPVLMSKDIMRFRVKISRKLKHYKSKIFRRYKRFSFLQKKFFKRFVFRRRRRSDLLYLYKKPRLYARWIPKRYFSRRKSRKYKKAKFFIHRIRQRYLRMNTWRNRLKFKYYRKPPKLYVTSPFRYQLINRRRNRKKFRIWLTKRFFGKRKRFVFRIFYFFRKLEKLNFNFKTKSIPDNSSLAFNSRSFFEKYRKFSLWALTYSWHKFYPRYKLSVKLRYRRLRRKKKLLYLRSKRLKFKNRLPKKSKKSRKKLFKLKRKKTKKKYKKRNYFVYPKKFIKFKFSGRKFTRVRTFRKLRQISRFLRIVRLAYKFPHNKKYFKLKIFRNFKKFKFFAFSNFNDSHKFFSFGKKRISFSSLPKFRRYKIFKFSRKNTQRLFYTRRRLPKIFYKNFFYKKNLPLAYYFTRKYKKLSVYFKTFRKRLHFSRFNRFKHRSRVPFRVRRLLNKLRFYTSKLKRSRFSKKLNKKLFFARRKYSTFLPYLGYFRKFGRRRFIFKRRRKKFFRFFRKFFSKFYGISFIPTEKIKFYKSQASKVRFFIHIFRSVNNMFINVSAPRGRTLYAYSAGRTHFRGSKRLSPVAVETMGKSVSLLLKNSKIFQVGVVFHTPIDYLVRALMRGFRSNIKFTHFRYHMTKPHNGLRLRSTRRI